MSEFDKGAVETNAIWAADVKKFNNAQTDWYGVCQKCGAYLEGTLAQLREHKCGSLR